MIREALEELCKHVSEADILPADVSNELREFRSAIDTSEPGCGTDPEKQEELVNKFKALAANEASNSVLVGTLVSSNFHHVWAIIDENISQKRSQSGVNKSLASLLGLVDKASNDPTSWTSDDTAAFAEKLTESVEGVLKPFSSRSELAMLWRVVESNLSVMTKLHHLCAARAVDAFDELKDAGKHSAGPIEPNSIALFKSAVSVFRGVSFGDVMLPKHVTALVIRGGDFGPMRANSKALVDAVSSFESAINHAIEIAQAGDSDIQKLIQLHSKLDEAVSSIPKDDSAEIPIPWRPP